MAIWCGADPTAKHPLPEFPQICFIKNTVANPNILIGDYTYYDDPEDSENFERNVLYHFPFVGDQLIIGKFCAIAWKTKFMMNGANHQLDGFSTYPFQIFGNGWEKVEPQPENLAYKGNTVIGNDVWIGYDALVLPGVQVGDGAVIGARSVVASNVPPYTIVAGNPAKVIRLRFAPEVIQVLLQLAWWNWPVEQISRHLDKIVAADLEALSNCI